MRPRERKSPARSAPAFNKIFNIGLNKAGTKSLSVALNLLGFRTLHFRHRGVRLVDIVRRNHKAGKKLLHGIEHYDAFSDMAGEYFFARLDREYPGSRFILTVRDTESWLDSRERHVEKNRNDPEYRHVFLNVDRSGWRRHMNKVTDSVTAYFRDRPADLLIINIPAGEGWDKLCPFLGVARPVTDFPNETGKPAAPDA